MILKIKNFLYPTSTIFLVLFFNSCLGDDACKSSRLVNMEINLATVHPLKIHDTVLNNLTIYSPTGSGLLVDSAKTSTLYLPLDPAHDTVDLVMKTDGGTDTLKLIYTRELYLLSVECGFITRYHIQSAGIYGVVADSVVIENSFVAPNEPTNLKIFY